MDKRKALPGLHTRERKAMRGESESERQRGRVRARTGGKVEKRCVFGGRSQRGTRLVTT